MHESVGIVIVIKLFRTLYSDHGYLSEDEMMREANIYKINLVFTQLSKLYILSRVKSWPQYFLVEYFLQLGKKKQVKSLGHAAGVQMRVCECACMRVLVYVRVCVCANAHVWVYSRMCAHEEN